MTARFAFQWVDAAPAPDRFAQRTMATLSIAVDGNAVTSVLDRRNQVYRDYVVVPLLHVAEWLVSHWWHLWHEVEDIGEQRPGFEARHDLSFAGNGFVLPRLVVVPSSAGMQLRWSRWTPRHAKIEFVDEGEAQVERAQLRDQFQSLIEAALARLRATGTEDDGLGDAWQAILSLDEDEQQFCRAAALLGAEPFDLPDATAGAIMAFWKHAAPSLREEVLASADAGSLPRVGAWLDDGLKTLAITSGGVEWTEVRNQLPLPPAGDSPWSQGYALAGALRRHLAAGDGRFDFEPTGPLAIPHQERSSPASRLLGIVAADAPSCVTVSRGASGRRFLLARALGEYLSRSEAEASVLCSLGTPRQARSRAFAAELLAPAQSLRERLGSPASYVEPERIDQLGREFGVSGQVVRHQIENHGIARIAAPA